MSNVDKFVKYIKKGDSQKVAQILQNPGFNVNELDLKSGKCYVQLAMENDEFDICKMLINHKGIDLNLMSRDGQSSLQTAILINSVEYVNLLLNKHINPKKRNIKGESVMHVAIKNKINPEIIKKLIQHHFDINQKIPIEGSFLNLAIIFDQFENFRCLIQHPNIQMKTVDEESHTSLMLATRQKKGEFIVLIFQRLKTEVMTDIEKQFYVNSQNQDGNTALHFAAMKDYQTILELILREGEKYGIDKELKNKKGKTYNNILQQGKQSKIKQQQTLNKRKEERYLRNKQKEEEKKRQIRQEQLQKIEEKKRRKQEQIMLARKIQADKETQKSKSLWIIGIGFVVALGLMYLLILNSIGTKKSQSI